MKWRCYVCGKPIGKQFVLWSLNKETDRVFLAHEKCSGQFNSLDQAIIVQVEQKVTPEQKESSDGK